jgi:hypothetical protein
MSARTGQQPAVAGAPASVCPTPPQVATPSMCRGSGVALSMRDLELPSGIGLPFVEQGDRSGVPVLLVHGYTDSWRSSEGVLAHLPGSVRALALTQRGPRQRRLPGRGLSSLRFRGGPGGVHGDPQP